MFLQSQYIYISALFFIFIYSYSYIYLYYSLVFICLTFFHSLFLLLFFRLPCLVFNCFYLCATSNTDFFTIQLFFFYISHAQFPSITSIIKPYILLQQSLLADQFTTFNWQKSHNQISPYSATDQLQEAQIEFKSNYNLLKKTMTTANRRVSLALPIIFIIFLVAIIIIYGFLTVYFKEAVPYALVDGTTAYIDSPIQGVRNTCLLIMDTLFTLLGFGLLLSPYKHQKWVGMSIALFVVSFNIILGLLFQDMWFEIFFGFRKDLTGNSYTQGGNAYQFWNRHNYVGKATASYYSFRLSNLCSTSYLVGMTAYSGRVTLSNIAFSLPIFCFLYYLNMYVNMLACYSTENKDERFPYMDAYGTILVYLFGGVYGIIVGALTKSPITTPEQIQRSRKSRTSLHLSILGSFIIFASFCLSYTGLLSRQTLSQQFYRFNSAAILVMFGLSAGVLGNYVTSLLVGKGKVNLQGVIIGTITGGIMVGGLADVIDSIGACLFIGFLAGCFSGLFSTLVTPKMNATAIVDSQGMLGPILVVAFLASFVVHPSVLHQFYIRSDTSTNRGANPELDYRVARYHLVYFAITLGVAAVTGLILGLVYKIKRNTQRDFEDSKFFADDYGLYDYKNDHVPVPPGTANTHSQSRIVSDPILSPM